MCQASGQGCSGVVRGSGSGVGQAFCQGLVSMVRLIIRRGQGVVRGVVRVARQGGQGASGLPALTPEEGRTWSGVVVRRAVREMVRHGAPLTTT